MSYILCIFSRNRGTNHMNGPDLLYIHTHTYIHTINSHLYEIQMFFYTFSCALATMHTNAWIQSMFIMGTVGCIVQRWAAGQTAENHLHQYDSLRWSRPRSGRNWERQRAASCCGLALAANSSSHTMLACKYEPCCFKHIVHFNTQRSLLVIKLQHHSEAAMLTLPLYYL